MAQNPAPSSSPAASTQPVRPLGVVTELQPGKFTLRTDAGPDLLILLPDEAAVLRVPPGSKDLKAATKINVSDINAGDRVFVRGKFSDDRKSLFATSVIVMSRADIASAREAERLDWQRRGIGGLVKAVDTEKREITISVPNTPPTPGNPTHPVTLALASNAALLRYAPDSVRFSDAKPGALEEIKVGDQVRALGKKSEDDSRFTAEKLVSGTFRNLGVMVVTVDAPSGALTVKDLATHQPLVVKTNSDSKLRRLSPFIAQMIAVFVTGGVPGGALVAGGVRQPTDGGPSGGARFVRGLGAGVGQGGGPRDIQQMLDRMASLTLAELKPGDALIVVSTEGAKPEEVTAITLLAGVEPILAAQPKGSSQMVLGPWNMAINGGEGGP